MDKSHLPIGLHGGSSKEYQRQCIVIHNRIKHREQAIRGLNQHLKNGTLPKRMKSLKPYPTMETPEAQAVVNEACQQVHKVMLEQRMQDYERKLLQDRASLQTLKDTRREQRQQSKTEKHRHRREQRQQSKTEKGEPTVLQLQRELRDLQAKYNELSQKLKPQES